VAKTKKKSKGSVKVARSKKILPKSTRKEFMEMVEPMFDKDLQRQFSEFLRGNVKVVGGKQKKEKPPIIDIRERTNSGNVAFRIVEGVYGAYNPETITVDTFDLMKKDPQISAGLAFIKLPIIALPWRVDCDDVGISKFVEQALRRVWRGLIRSTLTAVDYGFASHEKVFSIEKFRVVDKTRKEGKKKIYYNGNALIYKKIKPHHPSTISINLNKYDDVVGVTQTSSVGGESVTLGKDKTFLFTHDEEFGNPFGRSRLVAAYKYWYWKELMYQFMLMYFERRGSPPVIATAPLGRSMDSAGVRRENLDVALDLAASLLSNSVAALPYQTSKVANENMWDLKYLLDDKRGEMFIEAINHLDSAILKALWLPESTVTEGSSYGQSSVHADLFLMAEKGLVVDIEKAVNNQLIPILVQANFRKSRWTECTVEMESLDFNRKVALKELFLEMMRNFDNMVQIGMRPKVFPDVEKMCQILQIPVSTLDEEVDVGGVPDGADDEKAKKKSQVVVPKDGAQTKAVPRRPTRTSSTGSREVDRKTIRPGGKRADQMRSKSALSEKQLKKLEDQNPSAITEIYSPQPNEDGEIPISEKIRAELMQMATTEDGLKEIKKGLLRIKIWSQREVIPNYDFMDSFGMIRALNTLQDHLIDILMEAMQRKLSE